MSVVEVAHDRAEGRVSELMGVINSATAELVEVLGDVIDRDVWAVGGIRSPEQWVAWQCGVSPRRSRDLVCLARRRAELPAMTKLFDAGLVSEDAAAAVARRVPADRDAEVAELAPVLLHTQLTRWLSAVPRSEPEPDVDPEGEAARRVVVFGADRGSVAVPHGSARRRGPGGGEGTGVVPLPGLPRTPSRRPRRRRVAVRGDVGRRCRPYGRTRPHRSGPARPIGGRATGTRFCSTSTPPPAPPGGTKAT